GSLRVRFVGFVRGRVVLIVEHAVSEPVVGGSQRSFGSDPRTTAGIFSGGGEGRDMTGSGTTEQTTLAASADADGGRATEAARQVAGDGGAAAEIVDPTERRYPDATGTVEIGVTQVDYTIEGTGPEETPIIHVF